MIEIDQSQLDQYQKNLIQSLEKSRSEISEILLRSNHSSHILAAKQIQKASNDEMIELVSKLDLPSISHKVAKINEIDAALNNIQIGLYGLCSDCEEEINVERLNAQPTTHRCLDCDTKYKKQKHNHFKL
ncbi:MAG: TraR/DksA C4-type zinc finger protein [Psychromonas sp.]